MSDDRQTPKGSARVNSERFDTELEAVWYAANYYYAASYKRGREYIGVVFQDSDSKFGLTVRGDGGFATSKVKVWDVPHGTEPTAIWHSHIPATSATSVAGQILMLILTSFDAEWDNFSDDDRTAAIDNTKIARKFRGHGISIYLVTDTAIKRYTPGLNDPEKTWKKDAPSQFVPNK